MKIRAGGARGPGPGGSFEEEGPATGRRYHHAMPQAADHFPNTAMTWLAGRLDQGDAGLQDARRHVMTVYRDPLAIYIRGSSFRTLGEPEDLVGGFFADRLGRDDFLSEWLSSGRPLRRWLLVALKYYMLEQIRARKRDGRAGAIAEDPHDDGADPPAREFHRESARALLRDAMVSTAQALADEGMSDHWRVFLRHHLEGAPYDLIAPAFGVDPKRAAVMARTAARRFRNTLRQRAAWPGATDEDVDRELASLAEDIRL